MLQILTPSGWSNFDGVKKTPERQTIKVKNLTCTPDHLIKHNGVFIFAKDHPEATPCDELMDVYDALEVKKGHEYITNGVVSHNCSFQGSVDSLLPADVMAKLTPVEPIDQGANYRRFAYPKEGHKYFTTVDTARGLGKDYSVTHVFDVTKLPYEEVYIHQANTISPIVYAGYIDRIGKEYNYSDVLIELNDIGESIADDLFHNYEYENVLFTHRAKNNKQTLGYKGDGSLAGMKTTVITKSLGCSSIVTLIGKNKLIIKDPVTIDEFGNFIAKGNSYEAASGAHDDTVMTCIIFAWATTQNYFIENYGSDVRGEIRNETDEIDSLPLVPFGFIDNPVYDYERTNFDATILM